MVSRLLRLLQIYENTAEWLFIDLTLSTFGMKSITLTELKLLSPVLARGILDVIFTDASLLESILEQVAEEGNYFPIVVVGKDAASKVQAGRNLGFNVVTLDELERSGKGNEGATVDKSGMPSSIYSPSPSKCGVEPADLFSTTYYGMTEEVWTKQKSSDSLN